MRQVHGTILHLLPGLYAVRDYTFATAEEDSGFVRAEVIALLRSQVGEPVQAAVPPKASTGAPRRVYLSRRKSARSFTNEGEVEAALSAQGFDVVYLEKLGIREQIVLFGSVDVVVAPHGAGLANLVWCGPGTRVVELFSPAWFNDCFARLCCTVGARHAHLWARQDQGMGRVDVAELLKLLAAQGADTSGS